MPNTVGTKWGTFGLGNPGGVVTWSIVGAGVSTDRFQGDDGVSVDGNSFMSFDYTAAINQAFADWSASGNIEFMQVEDQGGDAGTGTVADIRIYFGPIPGGTIGLGFYPSNFPSAISGDVLIDSLPDYNSNQSLFSSVVLHELGHALGLGHVSDISSIMTASLSQSQLQADDIIGIQEIYGVQDNGPTVYDLPTYLANLNILDSPNQVTVNGNALANTISGSSDDETINGGTGNDSLFGGLGDDSLNGGANNDRLHVWQSNVGDVDVLNGSTGTDTADFSGFGAAVWADLSYTSGLEAWTKDQAGAAPSAGPWREIADLVSIENLTGTGFDDWLSGNAGANILQGGLGDDTLGLAQSTAGSVDVLNGGGDTDTADFSGFGAAVWVDLSYTSGLEAWTKDQAGAAPSAGPWREIADLVSIENLTGTDFDDWLSGNAGANILQGGLGDDTLGLAQSTAGSVDVLNGGGDTDTADFSGFGAAVWVDLSFTSGLEAWTKDMTEAAPTAGPWREIADLVDIENLTGTGFDDWLSGDAGANMLEAGAGNDTLEGDLGSDVFVFADGHGLDVIIDFDANNGAEDIDLSGIAAITSFNDLRDNHMSQDGTDVVIDTGTGSITLIDVNLNSLLDDDDFLF